MAPTTTVILGGGWGGLTAAHHLRDRLPAEHRIIVVERNKTFTLCVSLLWLMTGDRKNLELVRRDMSTLKRPGIEWVHAAVLGVDPSQRAVETTAGHLAADHLVIALGAELVPDRVPGFSSGAHNIYEAEGALGARAALDGFSGGKIVVLVAGAPFRCPAAPYEAAMLIEDEMRRRGLRDAVEVSLHTPEAAPMAVAGPAVGETLVDMLTQRGIEFVPEHPVTAVDAGSKTLRFADGAADYDLLVGIPPHQAPEPLSGMINASGYIPVHPQTMEILSDPDTLETQYPNVYAIGDVAAVRLLNEMLLPKAGVFAEGQAQVVAANIAAVVAGDDSQTRYDGRGFCYVETGDGEAAYGSGEFYAFPAPRVRLEAPTSEHRRAKEEYEALLAWFDD